MPVSHVFSCTIADDPIDQALGKVLPSHWDSSHFVSLDTSEVIKWISAGAQSVSSGTVVFSNSNGVSFGMNAGTITATVVPGAAAGIAAFGAGTQTGTSGTVIFADSNGISFGMSGSTRITASYTVPSTAGLLSAVNVSGGTTSGNVSQIVFADSNRVSFGLNAGTLTAKYALNFSAGTTSQNVSDQIVFSNSNGLAFGLNGSTVTGSYTVPSTAGLLSAINASAGTTSNNLSAIVFSNSNNVSFGLNGSTVTGTASFAQTNQSAIKGFGVSNTGQTAGNTGLSTGIDWVLAGSQSITLSQSTVAGGPNTVWMQHPAWLTTAMQSNAATISNIRVSAGTTSNLLSAITFADSNGLSFGINASTVTAGLVPISFYEPLGMFQTVGNVILGDSVYVFPMGNIPGAASFTYGVVPANISVSTSTNSSHAGAISLHLGIYTRNGSTLSRASSGSQSYQWTNTSNNSLSVLTNYKLLTVPININMTPGDYWLGVVVRTTTTNANWWTGSLFRVNSVNAGASGIMLVASATSNNYFLGRGALTQTSTAMPASMAFTDITQLNPNQQPYINFGGMSV